MNQNSILIDCHQDIAYSVRANRRLFEENIDNLKIGDFEEWDSIGSVNLILEIEKKYKIKFTTINFLEATSIKKIKNIISSKKR